MQYYTGIKISYLIDILVSKHSNISADISLHEPVTS